MVEQAPVNPALSDEVFQAKYIPKQKGPPAPDSPTMKAYLSTFPSLGQVTVIDESTRNFTAVLEVDEARASEPWQVSLWHSDGGEWHEVPLERVESSTTVHTTLQTSDSGSGLTKISFRAALPNTLPMNFTVKFRNGEDQTWKWARDHQGSGDGLVVLKSVTSQNAISGSLGDYVEDLNPSLEFTNHRSQSPGTTVWTVELPIEAASGEVPTVKDVRFGVPWGHKKITR
jgi:hypothetical protein